MSVKNLQLGDVLYLVLDNKVSRISYYSPAPMKGWHIVTDEAAEYVLMKEVDIMKYVNANVRSEEKALEHLKTFMKISPALSDVFLEVLRDKEKHPSWPTCPFKALNILAEEVGEVSKAVNELYFDKKGDLKGLKKEVIQVAAMCIRFLEQDYFWE